MRAFSPLGNAVHVAATASSVSGTLPGEADAGSCLVYNQGAVYVAVAFGKGSAPTAVLTTDTPVPPNTEIVLGIPAGVTHVAAIGNGAGPSTVIFQRGAGL